ncbi:MAG TPA: hypothetical protein PLT92_14260 [Ignavibacteriaceae bacterium]|nr:hypothetical protein [Ignavibacteriaceae bacterium]
MINIKREGLINQLSTFVLGASGVVIGSPGVGKTYTLFQITDDLEEKGNVVLLLAIDQICDLSNINALSEFNIEIPLTHYLKTQENKNSKNIVILDSFDSLRDESKRNALMQLLKQIKTDCPIWNIIVSVRTYDAKKSLDLLSLFPKVPNELELDSHDKSIPCRHFIIPPLNQAELNEVKSQSKIMGKILDGANRKLIEMLKIPYNLWLIDKLLSDSDKDINTELIYSEVHLLDEFWRRKISGNAKSNHYESLLFKICELMVKEKTLSVNKHDVYRSEDDKIWKELNSSEILIQKGVNEQRISFNHNILFDYAVNILLIDDEKNALEKFIQEDLSRPLFLRPSLVFYLTRLWYKKRDLFWEYFFNLLNNDIININLFARLIPVNVFVREYDNIDQLTPLLDKFNHSETEAIEAVLRILQALNALELKNRFLWASTLILFVEHLDIKVLLNISIITQKILESSLENNEREIINKCGIISRKLLSWTLSKRKEISIFQLDNVGAGLVLPMVIKTHSTNKEESNKLLNEVMSIIDENSFPINYFFRIALNIKVLYESNPCFVKEFYIAIFNKNVDDDSLTEMGTPVLRLNSTRKQDYSLCHYNLIKDFPALFNYHPQVAAVIAIKICNQFVIHKDILPYLEKGETVKSKKKDFTYNNKKCTFLADYVGRFGEGYYVESIYEPLKILSDLFTYLDKISKDNNYDKINKIVDIITENGQVELIWSKLIKTACNYPELYSSPLFDLCVAEPIILSNYAVEALREFLIVAINTYSEEQINKIECAVINIYNLRNQDQYVLPNLNTILSCIPKNKLTHWESEQIMTEFESITQERVNGKSEYSKSNYENNMFTKRVQPVSISEEEIIAKKYYDELYTIIKEHEQIPPDSRKYLTITEKINEIIKWLTGTCLENINPEMDKSIWSFISLLAEMLIKLEVHASSETYFSQLRLLLCSCAKAKYPIAETNDNEGYNYPVWSPLPRNMAALYLPRLFEYKQETDIIMCIELLLGDDDPSVRYLLSRELWRISKADRDRYFRLFDLIHSKEKCIVVIDALLSSLNKSVRCAEQESINRMKNIIPTGLVSDKKRDFYKSSARALVYLLVRFNDKDSKDLFADIINSPIEKVHILIVMTNTLLEYIKPQYLENSNINTALENLQIIIKKVTGTISSIIAGYTTKNDQKDSIMKNLYKIIDEIIARIYFNAQIPDKEYKKVESYQISDNQRKDYYFKTKSIYDDILKWSSNKQTSFLLASSSYYLIQYLNWVIKYDPVDVVNMAYLVSENSKAFSFHYDPLAQSEVIKLVEKVLSDYRYEFREGENLKTLVKLLDIFVDAGWPEAINLIWRLDELYY